MLTFLITIYLSGYILTWSLMYREFNDFNEVSEFIPQRSDYWFISMFSLLSWISVLLIWLSNRRK